MLKQSCCWFRLGITDARALAAQRGKHVRLNVSHGFELFSSMMRCQCILNNIIGIAQKLTETFMTQSQDVKVVMETSAEVFAFF